MQANVKFLFLIHGHGVKGSAKRKGLAREWGVLQCGVVWGVGTGALVVKCIGRVWEDFSYVKLTLRPKISYVCPVAPYRGEEGNHNNAQIIISVICFQNCQLLTLHRSLTAAQAEQEDEDNGKHGI